MLVLVLVLDRVQRAVLRSITTNLCLVCLKVEQFAQLTPYGDLPCVRWWLADDDGDDNEQSEQ